MRVEIISEDRLQLDFEGVRKASFDKDLLESFCVSDKSDTHRLIILASLISKPCVIYYPLISLDTIATLNCTLKLGKSYRLEYQTKGSRWKLYKTLDSNLGLDQADLVFLNQPSIKLRLKSTSGSILEVARLMDHKVFCDCAGSGTTARLMLGVCSGLDKTCVVIDGSETLRVRSIKELVSLLIHLGACIQNDSFPVEVVGSSNLKSIDQSISRGSSQIKSALILSRLNQTCSYSVRLPARSRNSTERILTYLFNKNDAGTLDCSYNLQDNFETISVKQTKPIKDFDGFSLKLKKDPSSFSYLVVMACFLSRSGVEFKSGVDDRQRYSYVDKLIDMGLHLSLKRFGSKENEGSYRLRVTPLEESGSLSGIEVKDSEVDGLVDELVLLMSLSGITGHTSYFYGVQALTNKESNRLEGVKRLLDLFGVEVKIKESMSNQQGFNRYQLDCEIYGRKLEDICRDLKSKTLVYDSGKDHRMIMCAVVLASICKVKIQIKDYWYVQESFPGFFDLVEKIIS